MSFNASVAGRFRTLILLIALTYCVLQIAYVVRLPLVMDEFDGAFEAFRLRSATPYRDFIPYKTVLGYYVQTLATFASDRVWGRIMALKTQSLLLNTAAMTFAAFYLRRLFRPAAIFLALLLLVFCSTFLERSSELRVDMLTGWIGLASLLLLLDRRLAAAGLLCGLSVLVSQKGIFYLAAANAVFAFWWLFLDRTLRSIRNAVLFNTAMAAIVALYVACWSAVAPFRAVIGATFLNAAQTAANNFYQIRGHYWTQVVVRNPVPVALVVVGAAYLLVRRRSDWPPVCAGVYGVSILVVGIAHTQPWPYFFVLLFPSFFVLHAAFFDAMEQARPERPFGLGAASLTAIGVLGLLYPATRIGFVLGRDNSYQRYNVEMAGRLLGPPDTYLAGTDIIHDRSQALPQLSRLDSVMLTRLRAEPQQEQRRLVAMLEARPPKLVIGNYRMYSLPPPLLGFIDRGYVRLTGSLLCYAPLVPPGNIEVAIAFDGRYRIDARSAQPVVIDGRTWRSGENINLRAGVHRISASEPLRLRLFSPDVERALDPQFLEEQNFYPNVYEY